MNRQDLRNHNPKKRRALKLSTVLKVLGALLLLAALWHTSPMRLFPECRGTDVPRHCVD